MVIQPMSKYVSLTQDVELYLDKECPKDEEGRREETYSTQIKRLLKIK